MNSSFKPHLSGPILSFYQNTSKFDLDTIILLSLKFYHTMTSKKSKFIVLCDFDSFNSNVYLTTNQLDYYWKYNFNKN